MRIEIPRPRRLLLLAAFTLAAHAAFFSAVAAADLIRTGSVEHDRIAWNLARGLGYVMEPTGVEILWRPPLYIFFLTAIYAALGHVYWPVVAAQAALNLLTVLLAWRLWADIFDEGAALAGALLLAIHPLFLYNALRLMTESLFTLLLTALVVALAAALRRPGWIPFAAVGLLAGLGTLCKASVQYISLLSLPFFAIWPGPRSRVWAMAGALGVMALTAAVVAPWTYRNWFASGGRFVAVDTSGGYTVWVGNRLESRGFDDDGLAPEQRRAMLSEMLTILGHNPTERNLDRAFDIAWDDPEHSSILMRAAIGDALERPFATLSLGFVKVYRFWFNFTGVDNGRVQTLIAVLQALLIAPAIAGIGWSIRRRRPVQAPLFAIAYFMLLHMAATANVRYSTPLLPFTTAFAVYGARESWRAMTGGATS